VRSRRIASIALLLVAGVCRLHASPGPHVFDSNGVHISYTDEGRGEPVVLIHGLHSSGTFNWRAPGMIGRLTPHFRVITLDLRGHGRSDKPDRPDAYGVQLAEDVIRLLDHLHIRSAHVAGYSLGGIVVMRLLVTHPDRIRSALLGGMGWLSNGSALQQTWRERPTRLQSTAMQALIHSVGDLAVTEAQVKAIRVPVEVVAGDRDPVRKLYIEPLMAIRPDWPLVTIANAGHLNCVAKPQFLDAADQWLRKNAGAH
jgi:pimeloyl-ACP methyl ester carboxylesterase